VHDISTPIKRFDFDDKVSGQAQYCADIKMPGMLYARTLRSERPRARISAISVPELPPDYYIVDQHDIPNQNVVPIVYDDQPFLARDVVNYIGEPILLVVGPDKATILQIIDSIQVQYEDLDPVLDIAAAESRAADFICGDKPWFVEYRYSKGDLAAAIAASHQCIEEQFETGCQEQLYLETQAVLAVYADERITVYGSIQCPYYITDALLNALGWPEERIRVVQLPTGGGFGGKEEFPSIPAVHAALAAIKSGRPVQLVYDRQEDIICSTKRHPAIIKYRSYLDQQGNVIGRQIEVKADGGAYAGLSSVVLQRMIFSANGVYNINNLEVHGRAYATNKVVSGAFRGFGGPQAFFAVEVHMENIARRLGQDPIEFKRRHFLHQGDTSSTGGLLRNDIILERIAAEVEDLSGYRSKLPAYSQADGKLRGLGCSFFFHGCGFTGSGEQDIIKAQVRLRKYPDERVEIFVSSTEIGQGVLTTLRKIVAQTLDIPVEQVTHNYPDTSSAPDSGPTVASRTIMIVGRLLADCAAEMKTRWQEPELDLHRDFQYPAELHWDKVKLDGNAYLDYSWGAQVVEAEVDPLTCSVEVTGIWAVYDIGTPIDRKIVQGQIEGGVVQGLGYGGMEVLEAIGGRLRQTNLTNYIIPTSMDFPTVHSRLIEDNPYPDGPFGARGLGELPLVGAAPALALAVQNAIGRKVKKIPLTPEYIMELMHSGDDDDQI